MIDPSNITNYKQTTEQLEENLLFWIFAAGHNAKSTAKGLDKFLNSIGTSQKPFHSLRSVPQLEWVSKLRTSGLGCWSKKSLTIHQLLNAKEILGKELDLKKVTCAELEEFNGIGPKTARCFLIHSRPNQKLAGLDTHILRYLGDLGYKVPRSTPNKKQYLELEKVFIGLCDRGNFNTSEIDLAIWNSYSSGKDKDVILNKLKPFIV